MILYSIAISAADSDGEGIDSIGSDKRAQWIVQGCMCAIAMIQAASTIEEPLIKLPTRIYKTLAASVSFLILLKCSKHYYLVDDSAISSAMRQGWEFETLRPEDKTGELFTGKARMGFNVARSTSVLVHQVVLKRNQQENETMGDDGGTGQAADYNMDMAGLDFFLDFDWDESLLSLPGLSSST
ncbi:hypothetical protein EIK77_007522 [Talaromyces pinophilus]|nr:hypothetical protein EIK77_007522 [Talaromyces pinophilus]